VGRRRTDSFMIYEGTQYSSAVTARFDGDNIVIDSSAGIGSDPDKGNAGSTTSMTLNGGPALHVKCIDGWDDGGDWAGYLQIVSAHNKGKWVDSSNGWVMAVGSKADPVWFIDRGSHYELWQGKNKNRPLVNSGGRLRFAAGSNPGRFNIKD
jgi:hypothetical protein